LKHDILYLYKFTDKNVIGQPDNKQVETYITRVNINKVFIIKVCVNDVQFVNTHSERGCQKSKSHRKLLSPSTGFLRFEKSIHVFHNAHEVTYQGTLIFIPHACFNLSCSNILFEHPM
jgi:hypothetical protein